MVTTTFLETKTSWFILNSAILLGLLILSRLPMRRFLRDFWTWAILLFILFLFQAFFTPGHRLSALPWLPISDHGLLMGSLTIWRLALIVSYAVLFTAVTRPRELRDSLIWFLKPFPFLPQRRIGLMVSLSLRFFSLILDQAEEVRLAHRARLGEQNKNPFRKAKLMALPILRRSLSQVEEVTFALAARGYRDDTLPQLPQLAFSNLIPLVIFLGFLIALW